MDDQRYDLLKLERLAGKIKGLREMPLRLGRTTAWLAAFLAVWCLAVRVKLFIL
jgi:hypothetical protein